MPKRRASRTAVLARKNIELAIAAPQVIARRAIQMANAGKSPSANDLSEFQRMGSEKVYAFAASWQAMAMRMFQIQQNMAFSEMRNFWTPWLWNSRGPRLPMMSMNDFLSLAAKGMAPVHRAATANARRLGGKSLI